MFLFFFLLAEDAFGKSAKCNYYQVAFDVTGSTARERLEQERAVLKITDGLQPCDIIEILLITEATFSNPEYVIYAEMPSRAGYFQEELKRAKIHVMNEFRSKAEKLSEERPGTNLIDGMWMFAKLAQEHIDKEKHIILLSDMIQHTKYLDEEMMSQDPNKAFLKVKADALVPNLKTVSVYVLGASTVNLTVRQWRSLEIFWRKFFTAAEARLVCYDMARLWPRE